MLMPDVVTDPSHCVYERQSRPMVMPMSPATLPDPAAPPQAAHAVTPPPMGTGWGWHTKSLGGASKMFARCAKEPDPADRF
jgi:hypothetical protein